MSLEIPEVVINRLPVYARALNELAMRGESVVSSQALGELLDVTPAQIRKDLSYFGRFGKQGRGYNVNSLLSKLDDAIKLANAGKVKAACTSLQDFINGVTAQAGKKISPNDASALIAAANSIRSQLGC